MPKCENGQNKNVKTVKMANGEMVKTQICENGQNTKVLKQSKNKNVKNVQKQKF